MIKLETTGVAPQAGSFLTIESLGEAAALILSTTDAWKPSEDDWLRDDSKRKQVISFINSEGRTCEIVGAVAEANAVEIASAHKVVALVSLKTDRKSGQLRLAVDRVVEVWSARGKQLWKATGWQEKGLQSGSTMTGDGKIVKAA